MDGSSSVGRGYGKTDSDRGARGLQAVAIGTAAVEVLVADHHSADKQRHRFSERLADFPIKDRGDERFQNCERAN